MRRNSESKKSKNEQRKVPWLLLTTGIAVPGMPAGSPGMEGPDLARYDVLAYGSDGNTTVDATRHGLTH